MYEEHDLIEAHLPCPDCGSSDGLAEYSNGTYCFVCGATHRHKEEGEHIIKKKLGIISNDCLDFKPLKARGITEETCRRYSYRVGVDEFGNTVQVADYFCPDDGKLAFQKTRDKDKNFMVRGKKKNIFFGQQLFGKGRKIVVTEGEIDCLTVSQVQGNKYPVVSLPFGVKSAPDTFRENLEWLEGFDEVIAMFDMDQPGRKAVESIGGLLSPHKLKIASLPMKDPNECLLHDKADTIINAIWNAPEYHPDGIFNAKDLKADLFAPEADIVSYTFPWSPALNKMTLGVRKGEMVLLTAGTGIGKSTAARELAYKLKMQDGLRVGMVMLEENYKQTLRYMLSIHMKKPLHLMWNEDTKEKAKPAFDDVFGDGNVCIYDHFGSIESDNLISKIRYMIVSEGCDFVIFDHVTIAVTSMDTSADERKTIDKLMVQLRSLIEETGAGLCVVSHLRKTESKAIPFECGGIISLDDLRGSGSLKQIPDTIIALERNQQSEDEEEKSTMKIRVLKCRFTGNTGLADSVRFNKATQRIEDIDPLKITKKDDDDKCQF